MYQETYSTCKMESEDASSSKPWRHNNFLLGLLPGVVLVVLTCLVSKELRQVSHTNRFQSECVILYQNAILYIYIYALSFLLD